jgi:hypothetical protein
MEVTIPVGNTSAHVILGNSFINQEGVLALEVERSEFFGVPARVLDIVHHDGLDKG